MLATAQTAAAIAASWQARNAFGDNFPSVAGSNSTTATSAPPVASGDVQVIDNTVTQPVGAMVDAGRYQVDARVVSADGHPITVTGSFTVTHVGHPATQPGGTPTASQDSESNTVTIVALCLVMLVVVALAIVIVRRRPASQ